MSSHQKTILNDDINIGCVVSRWNELSQVITAAAHQAGKHLGRKVLVEPVNHHDPHRYDVVLVIGKKPGGPLNKCAVFVDLEELKKYGDFDAVEKLAGAIEEAVCELDLQALS